MRLFLPAPGILQKPQSTRNKEEGQMNVRKHHARFTRPTPINTPPIVEVWESEELSVPPPADDGGGVDGGAVQRRRRAVLLHHDVRRLHREAEGGGERRRARRKTDA